MGRLTLFIHGAFTAAELVEELSRRLKGDFEILMVHSAFDRMLPMYSGTPQQLIEELIRYCGPNRTLVMPAFVLGGRTYDTKAFFSERPFDVNKTPSEMGLLTEVFRRTVGVKRSMHPTHSVCAIGPLADELTKSHHMVATRAGKGTPFEVMTNKKTVIAGLGVEYYRCVTHTHTAEDMLGDEFPVALIKETFPIRIVGDANQQFIYQHTTVKCKNVLDNTLLRALLRQDELVEWKFCNVALFYTYADRITSSLIGAARRGITVYGTAENC